MARAATTSDAFNAIAETHRRVLLDALADGELPVSELVTTTGMAQPQVSKHLRVLREVGAVEVRGDGRRRLYRVNAAVLKPVHDWLSRYEQMWDDRFEAIDSLLDGLNSQGGADADDPR